MTSSFKLLIITITLTFLTNVSFAQTENYEVYSIAFYNLENLFDTLDTPGKNDKDFLPNGSYKWTGKRYLEKQDRMASIVAKLGAELTKTAPTVVGFSEIENAAVLEDLIKQDALKKYNYGICHIESPDKRGVDVGLIYRKEFVDIKKVSARDLRIKETYAGDNWEFATRNQLIVEATLKGEDFAFLVNHWPSRRAKSPYREAAGTLNRSIIDSLRSDHPGLHCITMGDLNDDPTNKSVSKSLGAIGDAKKLSDKNYLYNPWYNMYKKGLGTLAYRDSWNLFDQIILTKELKLDKKDLFFYKAEICNFPELKNKEGRYKGYPFRTYSGGNYSGGYSDHFPVVIYLLKKI
ncbi:endonuclease/exonuclease/phosphatase family protein [Flammeovirga kamogawensis]|uniref:Endonuclease/exonuclease/phosphatase family protein n=1 Tax=Flammeovirga kamogawensis TaxID=373891 RepID=A0ABX8H5G2_9BACT|nr:endonuclease/exonuclease/phosphatase family protein [Flammeovirga kamogawensis]MBB6461738.1 hypothetical protein [Flammeovirga kamogawensis]QWG10656.1 endonuclease/exonuclease/phosphatase family protein [Flammeovirga kamogawensis]TRX63760.1 endonuclease/exonuclease/phosphatase family protein [Flammeovirga kamogawensis]